MRAGLGNGANHRRAFLRTQVLQLLFESRQALRGHRKLLHGNTILHSNTSTPNDTRAGPPWA